MVSHSTKQQHYHIRKLESVSILFCSPWRSSQSPHVPFELEWFQFFPPHLRFKDSLKGKALPTCGRKMVPSDSVTSSLSSSYFWFALLVCLGLLFWVSLVLCIALFNLFLFVFFSILVYFVFQIKNLKKNEKSEKIKKQCMFCVHWYLCTLDGHWNQVF